MSGEAILDILMITYNRAEYTARSLERLLLTCSEGMRVWVWQNGTDEATLSVVSSFAQRQQLHKIHVSRENVGIRIPTNWFWRASSAPFVAKVDDDCLVTDGWSERLISVHQDVDDLGLIACWHFYDEDVVPELVARKTRALPGGHHIMLNCWVGGSAYVMKRRVIDALGVLNRNESFTGYGIRACQQGWTNGWHLPFIHQEHMDDPRSTYSRFKNEEDFLRNPPLTARVHGVHSLAEWRRRVRRTAHAIQSAPYDPRLHMGWRSVFRRWIAGLRLSRARFR